MLRCLFVLTLGTFVLIDQAMAQPVPIPPTIVFSTEFLEQANNGMGPSNETATFSGASIVLVQPDLFVPYIPYECADFSTWAAHFGDEDADGSYVNSIVGQVDALYVPLSAPNPPNLFDVFLSFSVDTGTAGVLTGHGAIDDGDVVRLLPRGGFVPFITRAQIADAMNTTSTTQDVNGFCVDESTGDIYWTMTATQTVNGTSVDDGGVVRLSAANYIPNPDGTVASVTVGGAEIVLHEAEVHAMFLAAGLNGVTDLFGLEISPLGGSYVTSTGATIPNLLLVDDDSADGPAIVETALGVGQIFVFNGITFNTGPALGLDALGPNGFPTGNLSALALRQFPLADSPRFLDVFPLAIPSAAPTLDIDVGGATPNGSVILVAKFGQGTLPGGATPRWDIFESSNPLHLFFNNAGGFYEFYMNNQTDPLTLFTLMDPPLLTDASGYARRTYALPLLPPGTALCFQYLDTGNFCFSTPVIPVAQ